MNSSPTILYIVTNFAADFPEVELPYLQKTGWKIILLPRLPYDGEEGALTENVSVSKCLFSSKSEKLPFLFSPGCLSLCRKEFASYHGKQSSPYLPVLLKSSAIVLHAKNRLHQLIIQNGLENAPILVYTYWFEESSIAAGMLQKDFPKLRVISRAHGGDLYPHQSPRGYLPFRFIRYNFVDHVFPCSQNGLDFLLQDGLASEKATVARLGVPKLPKLAGISAEGCLRLYSCSNTAPVKRLSLLIESLAALARVKPTLQVSWEHLGGGDGFADFSAHAKAKLDCIENLQWKLYGQISPEKVREFIQIKELDGLVNVSHSEGVPVSMMEALSAGIPILGTDVGGVNEIVTPETGILLPANFTPQEFCLGAERLMEWKNGEKRKKNAEFASSVYDIEKNYSLFAQKYMRQIFLQ